MTSRPLAPGCHLSTVFFGDGEMNAVWEPPHLCRLPPPLHLEEALRSFTPPPPLTYALPVVFSLPFQCLLSLHLHPPPPSPLLFSPLPTPAIISTLIQSHSGSHAGLTCTQSPISLLHCAQSIAYSRHKSIIFPNGKSTLTWEDTPFPSQNARSTGTRAPANEDPGAGGHSHFSWDSRVMPSGPRVAPGVNGVLTEDATTAIKMQISQPKQRMAWICPS